MAAGIVAYGAYIPKYRLARKLIGDAWGTPAMPGERAVASYDEDSITMAVAAINDCLKDIERQKIDGCYFASTTSPYKEKQASALAAVALDLRNDILSADFAGSLRAGTTALKLALDTVNAGAAKQIVVSAADCRLASPNTILEQTFGDGAAAFLIGDEDVAVAVEGSYSLTEEFTDLWRRDQDILVKFWEERFRIVKGYQRIMGNVISGIMGKYNLETKDLTKIVAYTPDPRSIGAIIKQLGADPKSQIQDTMFGVLGNTGAAFAPMLLVAALENSKPGDRILFLNYGDGAEAYVLRVTEHIEKLRDRSGIKRHLDPKLMLSSYTKYLNFRNLVSTEEGPNSPVVSSVSRMWRDTAIALRFHGAMCKKCGKIQFPIDRVCIYCQAKDNHEEVRLSDKKATIFSFTADEGWPVPDPPLFEGHVNFEGGGRGYLEFTDMGMAPKDIEVGMELEMTFRKMHEGADFHNYFWKACPIR